MSLPPTVVVKCSWPNVEKEKVEPNMYAACEDAFGAPKALMSFAACFPEGHPMCNSIFLPPEGEDLKNYHWNVFSYQEEDRPKVVDCRTLWITVLVNEGQNLDECFDASDLCECLLHSMLGMLGMLVPCS